MRKFNIKHTLYGNASAASFTAWANSPDQYRFQFMHDTNTPEDLTTFSVGVYLLAGADRRVATCKRPASLDVDPDTGGVTIISLPDGRVDFEFLPSDLLVTDTAMWLEFWAFKTGVKYMLGQFAVRVAVN